MIVKKNTKNTLEIEQYEQVGQSEQLNLKMMLLRGCA
jgi:hypothetical protein